MIYGHILRLTINYNSILPDLFWFYEESSLDYKKYSFDFERLTSIPALIPLF